MVKVSNERQVSAGRTGTRVASQDQAPQPTGPLDAAAALGLAWLVWRMGLSPVEVQTVVLRKKSTPAGGS